MLTFYFEANSELTSPPNADEKRNPSTTTLACVSPSSESFIMYPMCRRGCPPTWAHMTSHFAPLISQSRSWEARPGCVNCLLGGEDEGRGYHLAFDQEGEVMVLLTSCFVSTQAQSPGSISGSLFLPSVPLRPTYCSPGPGGGEYGRHTT